MTFKEFFNPRDVEDAIISHRWTNDEVSYQDYPQYLSGLRSGDGWTKILQACRIARFAGYLWVWYDSCCIDKRSSAELSEAIKSMYKWYASSEVFYVFLSDVHPSEQDDCIAPEGLLQQDLAHYQWPADETMPQVSKETRYSSPPSAGSAESNVTTLHERFREREFQKSEWFTRGWTLQELLAPACVYFFNSRFEYIGSRYDHKNLIAQTTGAHVACLGRRQYVHSASIGTRMIWASSRKTTREEDLAYCLFDVNMPLLYGEGQTNAFMRLQLELIRKSDDETIFSWARQSTTFEIRGTYRWKGLLAQSPADFGNSNVSK
ncbi:uncharacterized protein LTR77_010617 [Saxophila tyrrhenica]|uniref:Heterokaryon incompatibility domain-containing protein n=1 Tax=Saxophila tyrrhenica TaxID=1690608 RepID=A0AAV9NUN5_9PEZI|nr:hypothetical protein LTR77_010617 [Saxophila tyrrhenica]